MQLLHKKKCFDYGEILVNLGLVLMALGEIQPDRTKSYLSLSISLYLSLSLSLFLNFSLMMMRWRDRGVWNLHTQKVDE